MNVIPPDQRETAPLPASQRPTARRALGFRLERLREEIENCQHNALEVGLLEVAEGLGRCAEDIKPLLAEVTAR